MGKDITIVDVKQASKQLGLISKTKEIDEEVFKLLDDTIVYAHGAREKSGILLSMALSCMKDMWDKWPLTSKSVFDFDFYKYANIRTSYVKVTIDNMVRAGRTWLQGLPDNVPNEVLLYDSDGEPTGEVVDPDPFRLSVSKLLVTSAAAKDGRLWSNEVALGQMFNPEVGVHVVSHTIQHPPNTKEDEKDEVIPPSKYTIDSLKLYLEGPFIMVKKNGYESDWVVEINTEGFEKNPIVKEAVKYLIAALQIRE